MEEIKPVVTEKQLFEYRDKSIPKTTVCKFQTIEIKTQRVKTTVFLEKSNNFKKLEIKALK